jgi:prepilin-type N-terminal cleavage/methylation domain-containing protein
LRPRTHRAFTLIELLIVIAIIGILATLLLTAISSAKRKSQIAVAKSHINAIKAALASYETDMGRFPRLGPAPAGGNGPFYDEAPALYAALRNQPGRGGGPNAPYLQDWKHEDIGVVPAAEHDSAVGVIANNANAMGANGTALPEFPRLSAAELDEINDLVFQQDHRPRGGTDPLVLLDPWGMPFHYREWSSVRRSIKNAITAQVNVSDYASAADNPGDPVIEQSRNDRARNPDGFDIWSNGPNRVNEYGHPDSDDVCSWR